MDSPAFAAIRLHGERIKRFVARHGERSALIFSRALAASLKEPEQRSVFLRSQPVQDEIFEADAIVCAIGTKAAALLGPLVETYYRTPRIDRQA